MRRRYMGGEMVEYTLTLGNIGGNNIQVYVDDVFVGSVSGGIGLSNFTWKHAKYSKDVTVSLKQTENISTARDIRMYAAMVSQVGSGGIPTSWIVSSETINIKDASGCLMCHCYNNVLFSETSTYTPRTSATLIKGSTSLQINSSFVNGYTFLSDDGASQDYLASLRHSYSGEIYEVTAGVEFCYGVGNIIIDTTSGSTYYINVS